MSKGKLVQWLSIVSCVMVFTSQAFARSSTPNEQQRTFSVGDVVPTLDGTMFDVNMPPPIKQIRNGDVAFSAGDTCFSKLGGQLTVVSVDGLYCVVRYSIQGIQHGLSCPDGIYKLIDSRWLSFNAERALEQNAASAKDHAVLQQFFKNNQR